MIPPIIKTLNYLSLSHSPVHVDLSIQTSTIQTRLGGQVHPGPVIAMSPMKLSHVGGMRGASGTNTIPSVQFTSVVCERLPHSIRINVCIHNIML